jgi:hypothetical protein
MSNLGPSKSLFFEIGWSPRHAKPPLLSAMHMPLKSNKWSAIAMTYGPGCRINPSRVKKIAQAGQSACVGKFCERGREPGEHAAILL